jgi:hypothetical protein
MKKLFFLFAFFFFATQIKAQVNLVPNYSFEDTVACPSNVSQVRFCKNWNTYINTPDYFNVCANYSSGMNANSIAVPISLLGGYQYPKTGNAYVGFIPYHQQLGNVGEYFGSSLKSPLIIGTKYYVSFYVSLSDAEPNFTCGINKLGLLFTNKNWGDTTLFNTPLKNNIAHIYSNSIIYDTLNWVKISGVFVADSAYQYFLIGNFFDDNHISFHCLDPLNTTSKFSYYLVDDVCISSDSIFCKVDVGIDDNIKGIEKIQCPSLVNHTISIKIIDSKKQFDGSIYNSIGAKLKQFTINSELEVNVDDLPNGIYFLHFLNSRPSITKKIIIQH